MDRVFSKSGLGFLLLGVVFAFIFTFLIAFTAGFDTNIDGYDFSSIMNEYDIDEKSDIYDYFGDVYKSIEAAVEELGLKSLEIDYVSPALYVVAILGTIIAAITIIAVAVLSILAVIKIIRKLKGREEKNAEKLALGAIFSYIFGAVALYGLNCVSVKISYARSYATAKSAFSPETLAGIILCSVFLGLALICYAVKNREEYKDSKKSSSLVAGLLSAVSGVIAVAFASREIFSMITKDSGRTLTVNGSSAFITGFWAGLLQTDSSLNPTYYAQGLVLAFFQVAIIALGVAFLVKQISHIFNNESKSSWCVSIALLIVSCAYLSLAVTCKAGTIEMIKDQTGVDDLNGALQISIKPAIIVFAFSVLTLASALFKKFVPELISNLNETEKKEISSAE